MKAQSARRTLITRRVRSSEEENRLYKQGIIQEDACLERRDLLVDLLYFHLEEHIVHGVVGQMLRCIAGNHVGKDGYKPHNGNTVPHTYLIEDK